MTVSIARVAFLEGHVRVLGSGTMLSACWADDRFRFFPSTRDS